MTNRTQMDTQIRKKLRTKAHSLKPVIMIGQSGLTEAVLTELNLALDHHELIKVRIRMADRETRKQTAADMCQQTEAELIQSIGQIAVLYRPNDSPENPLYAKHNEQK